MYSTCVLVGKYESEVAVERIIRKISLVTGELVL